MQLLCRTPSISGGVFFFIFKKFDKHLHNQNTARIFALPSGSKGKQKVMRAQIELKAKTAKSLLKKVNTLLGLLGDDPIESMKDLYNTRKFSLKFIDGKTYADRAEFQEVYEGKFKVVRKTSAGVVNLVNFYYIPCELYKGFDAMETESDAYFLVSDGQPLIVWFKDIEALTIKVSIY